MPSKNPYVDPRAADRNPGRPDVSRPAGGANVPSAMGDRPSQPFDPSRVNTANTGTSARLYPSRDNPTGGPSAGPNFPAPSLHATTPRDPAPSTSMVASTRGAQGFVDNVRAVSDPTAPGNTLHRPGQSVFSPQTAPALPRRK